MLLTGECEKGTAAHALRVSRFFDNGQRLMGVWVEHRTRLLGQWMKTHDEYPWAEEECNFYGKAKGEEPYET